ncbi:MAG: NYN domain-containing protein [Chloroflexi bacterium]|nr:NYN domain-containing protein [Chloroflexota bacterium]|tara:strand:- start:1881 stop:2696 length:816 start_codon:yes stop_codon:yes gene_type:complete
MAEAIEKVKKERVMVFIDGSNLYHVLNQHFSRNDIKFGKFAEKLSGERELVRTYYYNIKQAQRGRASEDQEKFLAALYDIPYLEVKLGIVKQRGDAMVEKGVDMMIGVDILKNAYEDLYDTAILVSGDGDFYPALQAAKDQGKHVEIAAFDSNISPETARIADLHIKLNKTFFSNLWMTKTDQKNAAKSYNKEEVSDELSSPEGENKKPKRKIPSKTVAPKRSYSSKYKPKTKVSRNSTSSRREVSPSTEPPTLNGSKSGEKKGWIKKIFS